MADDSALFRLLPLIHIAMQQIRVAITKRVSYVSLVSHLCKLFVIFRKLKQRFLLLTETPDVVHNRLRIVHRRTCYAAARVDCHQLLTDEQSLIKSFESVAIANKLSRRFGFEKKNSKSEFAEITMADLALLAVRTLLNPRHGYVLLLYCTVQSDNCFKFTSVCCEHQILLSKINWKK